MSDHPARSAVLVDRHPLWLEALTRVMEDASVSVTAKTTSARAALDAIVRTQPDVLVTGVKLAESDLDGIELVRRAVAEVPDLRAIVVSAYDDAAHLDAAFAAGVCAYVLKTAHPNDIAAAVRQAFDTSIFLASPHRNSSGNGPARPSEKASVLTRREQEILRLVAEGYSNAALARQLWVTEQTVKFHLSNIYRKLGVANRTEASRWAQVNGLLAHEAAVGS